MRKKRGIAAVIVILLLALSGTAAAVCSQPDMQQEYLYQEETVAYGALSQGITENGSVELIPSTQDFTLNLETDETEEETDEEESEENALRIEEVYLAAGQRIKTGTPVMKLTDQSIANVRRKLSSAQTEAEIALEEAQSAYETGALAAEQTYSGSTLAGANAETAYRLTIEGLEKEREEAGAKTALLELEIDRMKQELENGWEDFADLKETYEDAAYAFERVDESAITKYITLRDKWLEAKEAYENERDSRLDKREQMTEKEKEIEDIQAETEKLQTQLARENLDARQGYETDTLARSLAQEVYQYAVDALLEAVSSAEADCSEAKEKLSDFETFVGDGTVCAQGSGLVTEVHYAAGDPLQDTGALFSYVEEDQYVISVDVSEEDIPHVQVQDTVHIVFTAYEGENYSGTIQEIAAQASQGYAATVSYPVTVQIDGDTSKLFGGMTGDVTFVTEQTEDVLYVPRKAVIEENNKCYVYIQDSGGEKKLTEVQTGFTDGVSIEITEGLTEGQTIYVRSQIGTEE